MRLPGLALLLALGLPAAFATAPPAPLASPLVIGESFTLESKVLGETRHLNVYRPHVYGESIPGPLPVLYMPDGGLAEDFLHIAGLLQSQVDGGLMRPFLLVGIENTVRRRDLTGPTDDPKDREIAPVTGGSATFRAFIHDELMPAVKARYGVSDETAIIGESLAGLFIVETYFEMPDLFDHYLAIDPSLWWNRGVWARTAAARAKALPASSRGKVLYLASSNEKGISKPTAALAQALKRHAPTQVTIYRAMPQETHGTLYHPAALQAFRTVFKPPVAKP